MCGICGAIYFDQKQINEDLLNNMCRSFYYRGPDDRGVYINNNGTGGNNKGSVGFGHQRLSIIDLSSAGRQPMCNEDGTIWITYNGEIYNFHKLKDELIQKGHEFKSNTDTEVIIHLYEEEGLNAVNSLNGMFAFGIWDQKLNRLLLCRDRIGIKPLVYHWDGNALAFASELKALLHDASISNEIDMEALYLYLTFNYIPAPYTIYRGIRKLEPGHYLVVENGKLQLSRYWEVPDAADADTASLPLKEQEKLYKKKLFDQLSTAVGDRMIADVPLGAFLSGGIDSSIVVALMARHTDQPVKTFSIGFKNDKLYDETHYAREVASRYKTEHHEIKIDYRSMFDVLADTLSTFDEPFADSSAIPTYVVSRETRKHVKVALSGDGGDELFAGYRSYLAEQWLSRYMMIPAILREGLIEKIIHMLPDSRDSKGREHIRRLKKFIKSSKGSFPQRLLSLKEVFPEDLRRNIALKLPGSMNDTERDPALQRVQKLLEFCKDDRLNGILYSDLKDSLPGDMLTKVDWMSMKNSLEVRVPILDHRVVELAFSMQGRLKLRNGKTKHILKETFKDLLPPKLLRRPKAGFEIPISRWLKADLKFLVDEYLAEDRVKRQKIFDHRIVQSLIKQHMSGKTDTSWMLWNLIVFQFWYDKYYH